MNEPLPPPPDPPIFRYSAGPRERKFTATTIAVIGIVLVILGNMLFAGFFNSRMTKAEGRLAALGANINTVGVYLARDQPVELRVASSVLHTNTLSSQIIFEGARTNITEDGVASIDGGKSYHLQHIELLRVTDVGFRVGSNSVICGQLYTVEAYFWLTNHTKASAMTKEQPQ